MQIHYTGYRIRGFYRVAHLGHVWGMTSKHAQHRLAILAFSDRHGKIAASEAFQVSIRTLYRWCQTLNRHAGNAAALTPKSCPTIASACKLRYNSSSNNCHSAKGTGPIQLG